MRLHLFFYGAGSGNRTRLSNLEGWSNSHYTIPASETMVTESHPVAKIDSENMY